MSQYYVFRNEVAVDESEAIACETLEKATEFAMEAFDKWNGEKDIMIVKVVRTVSRPPNTPVLRDV